MDMLSEINSYSFVWYALPSAIIAFCIVVVVYQRAVKSRYFQSMLIASVLPGVAPAQDGAKAAPDQSKVEHYDFLLQELVRMRDAGASNAESFARAVASYAAIHGIDHAPADLDVPLSGVDNPTATSPKYAGGKGS